MWEKVSAFHSVGLQKVLWLLGKVIPTEKSECSDQGARNKPHTGCSGNKRQTVVVLVLSGAGTVL